MSNSSRLLSTCAALAMLAATPAFAADYDPPIYVEEAPEYVPVEIGSGWYLRGDVGYSFQRKYNDTSLRIDNSVFDGGGLVSFDPIVPLTVFSASENTLPVSGSIGVGYHINDYLRVDANIGLLFDDRYKASGFLGNRMSFLDVPAADFGCQGTLTTTQTTTVTRVDGFSRGVVELADEIVIPDVVGIPVVQPLHPDGKEPAAGCSDNAWRQNALDSCGGLRDQDRGAVEFDLGAGAAPVDPDDLRVDCVSARGRR